MSIPRRICASCSHASPTTRSTALTNSCRGSLRTSFAQTPEDPARLSRRRSCSAYVVLEPAPPVLPHPEQRRHAELWHVLSQGLPISSSIAESAVHLVVSHRMAKKQQMRWTDEGAHCLAQVRVAVLNEEFSVKKLAVLTKTSTSANSTSARRAA
jgi:hypothetical protein